MSAELTTAVAEYEQDLGIRPGTFCAYEVRADAVLDLRDDAVLASSGIEPALRFCAWKTTLLVDGGVPPTWPVARTLIDAGASGVLVPSVRIRGGTNLVLWRWNDGRGCTVRVLDPLQDLPRDAASWPSSLT